MTKINLPLSNRPLGFWTERSEMLDVVVDVASKPEFPSKSGSWKVQPSHQFVQGPGDGSVAMVQGVESTKLVVVHNSSFRSENVLLYWRILEIRRRTCWAISAREYFPAPISVSVELRSSFVRTEPSTRFANDFLAGPGRIYKRKIGIKYDKIDEILYPVSFFVFFSVPWTTSLLFCWPFHQLYLVYGLLVPYSATFVQLTIVSQIFAFMVQYLLLNLENDIVSTFPKTNQNAWFLHVLIYK